MAQRGLGEVVVDDDDREQHQENERRLIDQFFDLALDVAAHDAFDHDQQDQAAIEDGNRQEIEDAKIQTDKRH